MSKNGVLTIFVGQAGVQIGNSFWELLCAEHSIDQFGFIKDERLQSENIFSFFKDLKDGRCMPRCLLIDLEPTVVDEVRSGALRGLFHGSSIINGFEDSGGNFARGFFTVGRFLMPRICEQLRKYLEFEASINGVIIFRSLGGGTGSGLTSAVFDELIDLKKITRLEVPIYPSRIISSSTVEPYNAILSEHFCMEDVDLGLLFDNEAMFDICERELSVEMPTFTTINQLMSETLSCITSTLRFDSILNCDLNVLQTNLVPYPRIHFPISSFAPVLSWDKGEHSNITVSDLTFLAFDESSQLLKVDVLNCNYMSCTMFYRGNVSPNEVYAALKRIKDEKIIKFVDWCPTGFKVSISNPTHIDIPYSKMVRTKTSVAGLTNSSMVARALRSLKSKFQILYTKKAFMHWFISEGLEENEFEEAIQNIESLVHDYVEASDEHKPVLMPNLTQTHLKNSKDNNNNIYKIRDTHRHSQGILDEYFKFPLTSSTNKEHQNNVCMANQSESNNKGLGVQFTERFDNEHVDRISYRTDSTYSFAFNSTEKLIDKIPEINAQVALTHQSTPGNQSFHRYTNSTIKSQLDQSSNSVTSIISDQSDSSETNSLDIRQSNISMLKISKHSRNLSTFSHLNFNSQCPIANNIHLVDGETFCEQTNPGRFLSSCEIYINETNILL